MSDENNQRRDRRHSPARSALHFAMRSYTPLSFEDVPDVDLLRGKPQRSALDFAMQRSASPGLVKVAQRRLAVISKAAIAGNEIANQTMWLLVKYWQEHPDAEPAMDFVATWEECGRPNTSLQTLALKQQWQRTYRNDVPSEQDSWAHRLVAKALRSTYPSASAHEDDDQWLPSSKGMPMCALENPHLPGLQSFGEMQLGMINDAAIWGHEPASHAIWLLVQYWREHPDLEPKMDFEKVWHRCGCPHTALRELALMQQRRKS